MYLLDLSVLVEDLPQDGCDIMYEEINITTTTQSTGLSSDPTRVSQYLALQVISIRV